MNKQEEQLAELKEIRNLMERSSSFLSLSGLAGVIVGALAILGVVAAYLFLGISPKQGGYYELAIAENGGPNLSFYTFFFTDAALVLMASLLAGVIMARSKSRKLNLPTWDVTAKRLLINIALPLFAGGIYCLILLYHKQLALVAPATLIFYGLALLNASKYTIDDIRYLGIILVITGLMASLFIDYGLLFWAFGFGVLHIVYGIAIYFKYEK